MSKDNSEYLIERYDNVYEVVIGLEVHAQLLTKSKAYSSDSTEFGTLPNTNVSAILDFESFLIAPTEPVILFNLFKLARQSIVFDLNVLHNKSINIILQSVLNELKKQDLTC